MNKLPFSPIEKHHAWSDDPARDRAVRLAEDGVTRRATLEECIAGGFRGRKTRSEKNFLTPLDSSSRSAMM
jgi:hypothetical protein